MNANYQKLLDITTIVALCLAIAIYLSQNLSQENLLFIQAIEMSELKISVSIDDAHLTQIKQVSEQLQSSGMNVEQTLSSVGVISGSIQSDKLDGLYQVEGVKNIESQQDYKLAPPDSSIQ